MIWNWEWKLSKYNLEWINMNADFGHDRISSNNSIWNPKWPYVNTKTELNKCFPHLYVALMLISIISISPVARG